MKKFHIVSVFPDSLDSYLNSSIIKKAVDKKKIKVFKYNPMEYLKPTSSGLKERIDDKPYGGGPGMVLKAEPFLKTLKKIIGKKKSYKIIYFSHRGEKFTTDYAKKLSVSKIKDLILVCGKYEGIDSRVSDIYKGEFVSIGDYVLTGGEIPALVLIDCVSRQIEGVLGNHSSLEETRISSSRFYTRPENLKWGKKTHSIPKVLKEGNHKLIDTWRKNKAG